MEIDLSIIWLFQLAQEKGGFFQLPSMEFKTPFIGRIQIYIFFNWSAQGNVWMHMH